MAPPWLIGAAAALSLAMAGAWATQRATGKSGWIDAIWSGSVGVVAVALVLAQGGRPREYLILSLVALWSARLAAHIARRTSGAGDDPRYASLMREWGARAPVRLFMFLQAQALAGWTLAAAAMLAGMSTARFPNPLDWLGAVVAVAGLVCEAMADAQLAQWRRSPGATGVCEAGLWSVSRHPNYLGEWMFWLGLSLPAIDPSFSWNWGLCALLAPLQMYWLLTRVSGVPPLEAHMLRTRGAAFEDYVRRVPMFFPWRRRAGVRGTVDG
jgi:steroid 5-alpha reductase family enzyme